MKLLQWRNADLDGSVFTTSITDDERDALVQMARGVDVLEFGTAYGFSACAMGRVAKSLITVDPHNAPTLPHSLLAIRNGVERLGLEHKVGIMVGYSKPVSRVLYNAGATFDLIFIDADHNMRAVMGDLEIAVGLLRDNGTILLHDYDEETCPGVKNAVEEYEGVRLNGEVLVDTLYAWRPVWDQTGGRLL